MRNFLNNCLFVNVAVAAPSNRGEPSRASTVFSSRELLSGVPASVVPAPRASMRSFVSCSTYRREANERRFSGGFG